MLSVGLGAREVGEAEVDGAEGWEDGGGGEEQLIDGRLTTNVQRLVNGCIRHVIVSSSIARTHEQACNQHTE